MILTMIFILLVGLHNRYIVQDKQKYDVIYDNENEDLYDEYCN